MPVSSPVDQHFQHLARLIQLEAEAEKQEDLRAMQRHVSAGAEASGNSLVNLVIRDQDAGLGGSILLTLAKRNQNLSLTLDAPGKRHPGHLFSREPECSGPGRGLAGDRQPAAKRFHPGSFCRVARGWASGRIGAPNLSFGPLQR